MTTTQPRPAPTAGRRSALLVERTVLDEQARASLERDPDAWGVWTWLGPLLALTVLLVGQFGLAGYDGPGQLAVAVTALVGTEILLLAALVGFGRRTAARGGGWRATFGLDRVRAKDWLPWIIGFGIVFAVRAAISAVAVALTDGPAADEADNLGSGRPTVLGIVVLGLTVVVLAPITEELMFRGLLLRSFLRRMSFWPAAALSSTIFALFHVPAVDTALGAVTLALSVGALGMGNCFVVRITGRLAPAMMVHATVNALALTLAFTVLA